ncbi:ATP-binding protein, partial [Saccharomonospora sp. NPDC046836]|uniref:sensor histidine kinase n=1 Tax=Saccharomonospora sp. NPDC046836 TaxID=3156921 RepID=UPI0033D1630D
TDGGVMLGVLLVAAVLTMLIARSLLRPLRLLRRSALDVAQHRLPEAVQGILADPDPRPEDAHRRAVEPVPVFSREELGQVARAFDAVHGEAVRLAGEQALLRENVKSMFVNLSRRSQDLVERQLTVLDRMEEHEQDPDILAGLFELDHLATRMRRNSENLLVLAGQDAGRPLPGSVSAEEIIGAALSEVEHYQRIKIAATPRLAVRGDAVSDLVHVISELFENATDYSGEDAPVAVVSAMTAEGQWRIDITDRGAGMPETEIRRTNARLAQPPEVDVEVSRRMGLYVVARLSQQHQIQVRLSAADIRGLTATVLVPADLIRPGDPVSPPTPEPPPAPAPGHTEPELPAEPPMVAQPAGPRAEPASPVGQPRRAPVQWEPLPAWPTEQDVTEDEPALASDTPTDRMPAYQAVVAQWFETIDGPPTDEIAWPTEDGDGATVSRSAEAVRSRMASLQSGVQRGRHARAE